MVAQVDEQQAAMIALAVDPATQAHLCADIGLSKRGTVMRAIGVHRVETPEGIRKGRWRERRTHPMNS
tara:strand:- start:186429 stop:186632 length:204 start_codon:yes stop_codon:yes gene_type:complete